MAHKNRSNYSAYKERQKSKDSPLHPKVSTPVPEKRTQHRKPQELFSFEEANDRLYDLFRNHQMDWVTHAQRRELLRFFFLLMQVREKVNVTRLVHLKDVAIKHFVDCLMVDRLTKLQFPLLDLGTGPGFPGIPLKILHPEHTILLAEGVQKRVDFLKLVRAELGLQHLPIVGRNINPYFAYPVKGVITRAVEDIRNTLINVITSLQLQGRVYFMKGPNVDPELDLIERETYQDQPLSHYYRRLEGIAYEPPSTPLKRRLLVFEKIASPSPPDWESEPWPEDES